MPLYIIERTFAEQLELSEDDVKLIEEINADEGVRWLFSFLSADRRRTYCLYEAPSAAAIMSAARRGKIPADAIVEVEPDTGGVPGRPQDWGGSQAESQSGSDGTRTRDLCRDRTNEGPPASGNVS